MLHNMQYQNVRYFNSIFDSYTKMLHQLCWISKEATLCGILFVLWMRWRAGYATQNAFACKNT